MAFFYCLGRAGKVRGPGKSGDGTITETGSNFHITLPGQGVILLQSGRLVVDLSFSEILEMRGPHDAMTGNYAAYCAAIA